MAKLKVNRGTTYARTITYYKNDVLTPLTGCTVFFTMKPVEYDTDATDTTASVKKTYSNLSDENAAAGKAVITLLPSDTADLDPNIEYYYDIKIYEDADTIYKVDEGTIELDGSPTNRIS